MVGALASKRKTPSIKALKEALKRLFQKIRLFFLP